MSYQFAAFGILDVRMSKSTMGENYGESRWSLSEHNSMPLLHGVPESLTTDDTMRDLLLRWVQDRRLRELNLRMVAARAELEQELERFRTMLKEVTLRIDQTGG